MNNKKVGIKLKLKSKELSSPHLKDLKKEFEKIQRAGEYLDTERVKVIKDKEKIMLQSSNTKCNHQNYKKVARNLFRFPTRPKLPYSRGFPT
jgi:hypothetical protein